MKKIRLIAILAAGMFVSQLCHAADDIIKLPAPDKQGGKPLMEVLDARASFRDFSSKEIDKQTLSEILWAAFGKNSHGTRTIPTARNKLNLKVYAAMKDGVWLYDGDKHTLTKVTDEDIRPLLAKQDYVFDSPLNLIFTGSDEKNSALHAGSAYQNVSLYAASVGMVNVVRGLIDHEKIHEALNLEKSEKVIISQTIGYKR